MPLLTLRITWKCYEFSNMKTQQDNYFHCISSLKTQMWIYGSKLSSYNSNRLLLKNQQFVSQLKFRRQGQIPILQDSVGVLSRSLILCNLLIMNHFFLFILRTLPTSWGSQHKCTLVKDIVSRDCSCKFSTLGQKFVYSSVNIKQQVRRIAQMQSTILDRNNTLAMILKQQTFAER